MVVVTVAGKLNDSTFQQCKMAAEVRTRLPHRYRHPERTCLTHPPSKKDQPRHAVYAFHFHVVKGFQMRAAERRLLPFRVPRRA